MDSLKQAPNLNPFWDAILIGSGIGALATAATLAKHASKRVLVLERHYTAGGYTHAFHRPGYEWDVGVHYIGQVQSASQSVRRAFDYLTNGQLQWAPMPDVYDRVILNGRTYDFPTGRDNFRAQLQRYFPKDTAAIDRYLKTVQASNHASGLYFAEKALPRPIAAVAGPLLRRPFLRWAGRATLDVLREFTSNEELIGVLTAQWGDYGLPPAQSSFGIHAMIAEHYFDGASYPIGGSSRICDTIAPVIEAAGGQILVSAEVSEILLEKGRAVGVRMAGGREFRAPIVISDAGARNTFDRLLPSPPPALAKLRSELHTIPPSMAHLSLYVGLKHTAAELGLTGTNLWIHPTPDHDANLRRFSADPNAPFPVLFVSFPSAKDPDFERRHPGRATLEIVTAAPYDWFARWEDSRWRRRPEDYNAFKQQLAARLQAELERHVPAVAGKIDYAELSTPLSTRHFMNYERGEAYGLSATPDRFQLRGLRPQTPIPGLYLTGQDVVSLGVTGALFGGVVTASAVLGGNLMSVVTGPARTQRAA
ncbi:MAG: NAD(P)/FAD-dependent oxidoreductase [Bryobacterales bacterium]|nr:NAD(P)/FAD-dependent oxidoreductase [Bryobacterales bacterium]